MSWSVGLQANQKTVELGWGGRLKSEWSCGIVEDATQNHTVHRY